MIINLDWAENAKRWRRYFDVGNITTNNSISVRNAYAPWGTQAISFPQQAIIYPQTQIATANWQQTQQALFGGAYHYSSPSGQLGAMMGLGLSGFPPETDAEKAERLKRIAEREAKRQAAEQRAEHLLFSILTPTQVKSYTDDRFFDVPIIDKIYRIKRGVARNIEVIEAGKVTALLCAHPSDAHSVPVPDVMLSQLLALQADEAGFLKVANRTVMTLDGRGN